MTTKAENLVLSAIGLTRTVFVNGEMLKPSEGCKFDWGYIGGGSKHFAYRLLEQKYGTDYADARHEEFLLTVIAILPNGNFNVTIDIPKWNRWHTAYVVKSKHPYALVTLRISKTLNITKFLDLPNNDIKSGVFREGTIEFAELQKLDESELLKELNRYYKSKTTTMDVRYANKKIWASIKYDAIGECYIYSNGMGRQVEFTGCKICHYDI